MEYKLSDSTSLPQETDNTNANQIRSSATSQPVHDQQLSFSDLPGAKPDLVCFSHLRWNFVFQRPQHLITRFAKQVRVFFIEEPIWDNQLQEPYLEIYQPESHLWVVIPHLPEPLAPGVSDQVQAQLIDGLLSEQNIQQYVAWYYTPMALGFSSHLQPLVTVYDCMDELAAFKGASPQLLEREKELFRRADLVFTGGQSLYEAKRDKHARVYAFPSSIDRVHFGKARQPQPEPEDQVAIPHPRLGFFGVLDERLDIELLSQLATAHPEWHFVLLGPIVKISPDSLPQAANIHYLGMKSYEQLPQYLASWDAALLLFAMNESTRFISPTKTPEYLAAGRPVVSTPIRDVVRPYGDQGLVSIAADADAFGQAIEKALTQSDDQNWRGAVDKFLSNNSWDQTWAHMTHLICEQFMAKRAK